jgi:hypothetical protein
MKMNENLLNGWISDSDVGYTTKTEGYTTFMSDMNKLYEISSHAKNGGEPQWR